MQRGEDMRNPWYLAFFVVGVLASSFHLGVGIWNFLCKWGLAATVKAQQAAGRFGALVGVAFSVVGILIILSSDSIGIRSLLTCQTNETAKDHIVGGGLAGLMPPSALQRRDTVELFSIVR